MAERRPLSAGVNKIQDSELVRSFIAQEPARPVPKPEPREISLVPTPLLAAMPEREAFSQQEEDSPKKAKKGKRGPIPVGLIPITVRLRPEIAAALKRASLQRQLTGEEIYTQQDLVELALEPWLKGKG